MTSKIKVTQTLIHVGVEKKVVKVFRVSPFALPAGMLSSLFTAAGQLLVGWGSGSPAVVNPPTIEGQMLIARLALAGKMQWESLGSLTGFFIELFPRSSGMAPSSGLAGAALGTVQSTGAGTVKPEWPILAFDAATDEGREWNDILPYNFGSAPVLAGQFTMASATSGNVVLAAQAAAWSDGDAVGAKVFDTDNSLTVAVPGTAGLIKAFAMDMTNFDGAVALDSFSLAFRRNADDAGDTATGDMNLKSLGIFFSV